MTAWTIVSRLTGQLRMILLIASIGATGLVADAFDIANNVPTALNLILTGGVFNAILLPQFSKVRKFKDADLRTNKLLSFSLCLMFFVTFILTIATPFIITLISNANWSESQRNLAIMFGFFCMPQIFFYGLYTILGQVLAVRDRFGTFGFAPVMNNLVSCVILGSYLAITNGYTGWGANIDALNEGVITLLGLGSTLGIAAQSLVLLVPLKQSGLKFKFTMKWRDCGLRSAASAASWSFISILVQEVTALGIVSMISGAPGKAREMSGSNVLSPEQLAFIGGNAAYTSAMVIYLIPHALVTVSIVTTIFARIAKLVHDSDQKAVIREFRRGIDIEIFIMTALTILMMFLCEPITKVLLPSASDQNVVTIGIAVLSNSIRLVPLAVWMLSTRVFFSYERTKDFCKIDIPCQLIILLFCFLTTLFIIPTLWLIIFCVIFSVGIWIESLICLHILKVKIFDYKYRMRIFLGSLTKAIFCGLTGLVGLVLVHVFGLRAPQFAMENAASSSWLESFIYCAIVTLIFAVVYIAVGYYIKVPIARSCVSFARQKILNMSSKHVK